MFSSEAGPGWRRHEPAAEPRPADLRDAVQRLLHRPARRLDRTLAPLLQLGNPLTLGHLRQRVEQRPLPGAEQVVQGLPQPLVRVVAHLRHQPCQRGHARQQHIVPPEPAHRVREDRFRAVPGRPGPRVQPVAQLLLPLLGVVQPELSLDLLGVLELRVAPLHVPAHAVRVRDLQLSGEVADHLARHGQRVRQEQVQIPHRGQLHRETETVMIAAPTRHQALVDGIEKEQLLHLRLARSTLVGAVRRGFLVGREFDWHGPGPYEDASQGTAGTGEPLLHREFGTRNPA